MVERHGHLADGREALGPDQFLFDGGLSLLEGAVATDPLDDLDRKSVV